MRYTFAYLYKYYYGKPIILLYKRYIRFTKRFRKYLLKSYPRIASMGMPRYLPRSLGVIFTLCFALVVAQLASAVTPNPGHPWTEIGDGLVIFSTPSGQRTYTLPDANTSLVSATSGSAGYLPRWLTATILGTSTIIQSGNNIGIGVAVPADTLDVGGKIKLSSGSTTDVIYSNNTNGLTLQAQGNSFGTVQMTIQNVNGSNGVLFEQNSASNPQLIDFGFKTPTGGQRTLRFETRVGNTLAGGGTPEFQFGTAGTPGLVINDTTTYVTGRLGVGSSTPGSSLSVQATGVVVPLSVTSPTGGSLFTILANGAIGIGTSSPIGEVNVVTSNTGSNSYFFNDNYESTAGDFAGRYVARRARGTVTAPSAVQTNDELAGFGGRGYGATAFDSQPSARMSYYAAENWTDTAQGTYAAWFLQPTGGTVQTEVMRLLGNGNLGLGTTTPQQKLTVSGSLGLNGAFFAGSNASGTLGNVLQSTGTSTRWVATSTLGLTPTLQTIVTRAPLATGAVSGKVVNSLTVANIGMFSIPSQITVNQVSFTVTAVGTAGTMKFCVYNEAGSKLIDVTTGTISASTINTAVAAVTLPAGNYYVAQLCASTCSDTVSYFTSTSVAGFNAATVPSGKKPVEGTGTMTSGTCNTTLPTITPTATSTVIGRLDN